MPSCSSKGSGPAHILLWCHLSPYTRGVNITVTIAYTCSSFPVVLPTESFLQFFYSSVLLLGGSIYPLLSHISGVGDMALLLLLLLVGVSGVYCLLCLLSSEDSEESEESLLLLLSDVSPRSSIPFL